MCVVVSEWENNGGKREKIVEWGAIGDRRCCSGGWWGLMHRRVGRNKDRSAVTGKWTVLQLLGKLV